MKVMSVVNIMNMMNIKSNQREATTFEPRQGDSGH
jgi:hypothetical protein